MLDLGWSEILIIGVVALIVVGPKDLPKMLRTLGQYAGRAKGIAREFQRSMDDAARQADIEELRDVKKGLDDMRDAQHKMQRDMSQSFLDGPSKPATDKSAEKPAKAEAAPADEPAPKPAQKVANKAASKSKPKSSKKVAEPKAEPGSVSGA
jgi:sec-independent protein translocase protein TatB